MDLARFINLLITLLSVGALALLCATFDVYFHTVLLISTLVYVMDTNFKQQQNDSTRH